MRVTQNMITDTMTRTLLTQQNKLYHLGKVVASGSRILSPSDDPLGKARSMEIRAVLSAAEQYLNNINRAQTRLDVTEKLMSGMEDQLKAARETASSGMGSPADNQVSAGFVKTLREQLLSFANHRFENQYLFAGRIADTMPFLPDGTYQGDDGDISIITGHGTQTKINISGTELFQIDGDNAAVITALIELENAFITGDTGKAADQISIIDAARTQIQVQRTALGMKNYQLTMSTEYWTELKQKLEILLADIENADMTTTVIELKSMETAYQTALHATARIIQPTILDYL